MATSTLFAFNAKEQKALKDRGLLTTGTVEGKIVKVIDTKILGSKLTEYILANATVSTDDEVSNQGVTVGKMAEDVCGLTPDFREEAADRVTRAITGRLITTWRGAVQKLVGSHDLWLIRSEVYRHTSEGYVPVRVYTVTNDVDLLTKWDTTPRRESLVKTIDSHRVNDGALVARQPAMRAQILAEGRRRLEQERAIYQGQFDALTEGMSDDEKKQLEADTAALATAMDDAAAALGTAGEDAA